MQKEKCLFIFNLPETDLKTALEKLHNLHYSTFPIKESNSHIEKTTLVTCLYNRNTSQEIIRNIHKQKIDNKTIYALLYDQLDVEIKDNIELYNFDLHELLEWQTNRRNEQIIACNNDMVRVFDNTWNGVIPDEKCFDAKKAVGSMNGLFVAVMYSDEIVVYGNKSGSFKPFQVVKMQNVTDIYFLDDDFYLFVNYKEIFNYTCIINLLTGKNIFVVKCLKEKVRMFKDKNVCYLENTNCIFERRDGRTTEKMFFEDETRTHEKFLPVIDKFMGHNISDIDKIHENNHFLAVLTNEKIKAMYLYYKNKLVKKKTYTNFAGCNFYSTKERIFAVIEKRVDERTIICVESTKVNGESTINNIKETVSTIQVADDGFVINTSDLCILFFDRTNAYNLVRKIKKSHKIIYALNKNGKICCVYDYGKDMIEFYARGALINRTPHANCTNIEWSQSGLYCATMSVGPSASGLVQVFDVNGNFLWKHIFNKLNHFEWRRFYVNEDCIKYVKDNYELLVGEVEEEDKDIKKMSALQAKSNIEETYRKWITFLEDKKEEYENYQSITINKS